MGNVHTDPQNRTTQKNYLLSCFCRQKCSSSFDIGRPWTLNLETGQSAIKCQRRGKPQPGPTTITSFMTIPPLHPKCVKKEMENPTSVLPSQSLRYVVICRGEIRDPESEAPESVVPRGLRRREGTNLASSSHGRPCRRRPSGELSPLRTQLPQRSRSRGTSGWPEMGTAPRSASVPTHSQLETGRRGRARLFPRPGAAPASGAAPRPRRRPPPAAAAARRRVPGLAGLKMRRACALREPARPPRRSRRRRRRRRREA